MTPPGELPKNDPFLQKQSGRPNGAYMTDQIEDEGIDEDVSPPTKISYISGRPTTLHLRKCKLIVEQEDGDHEFIFDQPEIRIGAMDDNEVVVDDDHETRRL